VRADGQSWARDLVHPVPLGAAAVLAINDHALKAAGWPSAAVAGKLSDVAGLFVFPILATALSRGLLLALGRRRAAASAWLPALWLAATAAAFAALKLSPPLNAAVSTVWGRHALDRTDLLALPVLLLSGWWLARRRAGEGAPAAGQAAALALVALTCAATSPPRYARNFPSWEVVSGGERSLGCARASAWVSKSGKTGLGVSVRVEPAGEESCRVRLTGGALTLADGRVVPGIADGAEIALSGCVGYLYLPFELDNEAAWNLGVRSGTLALTVEVDGVAHTWRMPAEHRLAGYHVDRYAEPAAPSASDRGAVCPPAGAEKQVAE